MRRDRVERDRTALVAFVVLIVIAGGNAVGIRSVSCDACELEPFWGAGIRFTAAGLLFAAVAAALGVHLPRGRSLVGAMLFGTIQFAVAFGLTAWGLVRAPAGLAQVLLGCVPLVTFGLALLQREERFRWDRLAGATLAVAGIGIVFSSGADRGIPFSSMLAILAAAVCFGEAIVIVKRFPPVHPAAMNAVGMTVGGVMLLALAAATGERLAVPREAETWTALAYLVFPGSVGVFWLYVVVVRRWSASAASYQLVLIPLVTVALAAILQDEPVTAAFAVGSVFVLVGAYVGALRQPIRDDDAVTRYRIDDEPRFVSDEGDERIPGHYEIALSDDDERVTRYVTDKGRATLLAILDEGRRELSQQEFDDHTVEPDLDALVERLVREGGEGA